MDEVPFCGNVKSWIDAICERFPDLPFSGADIEIRQGGRRKRRDLVLRPRDNRLGYALTGEVKLPDTAEGRSPYAEELVLDAHQKANDVGAAYFFTWNVNKLVLWETFRRDTPITRRNLDFFDWSLIRTSHELDRPDIQTSLKEKLEDFLRYFAPIYEGFEPFPKKPLDKWFIHLLESALDFPTMATLVQLHRRYDSSSRFKAKLDQWLVQNLGATISDQERNENLERAAKFSCYVLTNKIVFYDALRRKYPKRLKPLIVSRSITTGAELYKCLQGAFRRAELVSEDYETIFEGDSFGDSLPLLSDDAIESWRRLVSEVDAYDFTSLDYDIIGQIFDGLISPGERHRFGQHYTKSEIVDLINAFTIRSPRACILDPACGGGTFPVRAYARKKWLADRQRITVRHEERLAEIYGVDISSYAAHLSTISLATRDLIRAANYPRVATTDFLSIEKGMKQFPAGNPEATAGNVYGPVSLPDLDAVVGNPPYIRQENLTADQKARYRRICLQDWPSVKLSGRSDIYVYFWLHSAAFLKPNGWLGFLTSSSWLDVEYGFPLQRFILERFCIVAILESSVEPWFTDARVATAVTLLRLEPNQEIRATNIVKFIQIRRPLVDILEDFERAGDRLAACERVREFLQSHTSNVDDGNWRIRAIRQSDLVNQIEIETSDEDDKAEQLTTAEGGTSHEPASSHSGDKWGRYLRAPDIFFELLRRCGESFVPLGKIATVRYGLKSGCDEFFFLKDVTDERLTELGEAGVLDTFGIRKKDIKKIRICKASDGSVHLIESAFLEPEVHSLMELNSLNIDPTSLERMALIVNEQRAKLKGAHVLNYIQWGERQGFHKRETCAARENERRAWYQIEPESRSIAILPMIQQYRHMIPINDRGFLVNHSLLEICNSKAPVKVLAAVLNSTIVGLMKWSYGRGLGREANLQLDVYAAKMMPVPDASKADQRQAKELERCFDSLARIPRTNLADELQLIERQELDDAVLRLVGIMAADERRKLRAELYGAVQKLHSDLRALELKAQADRLRAARRGKATPHSIATEIWESLKASDAFPFKPFPKAFIPPDSDLERFEIPEGRAEYRNDLFETHTLVIGKTRLGLDSEDRVRFLLATIAEGIGGTVWVPRTADACRRAVEEWVRYRRNLDTHFEELASERTANPQLQKNVVVNLWRQYHRWSETAELA